MWTFLLYRFVVKNHFESAKKEPSSMLIVFCKLYIFVLCLVTEGIELLLWTKKHARRGLEWNQLIGDPPFVGIYLLRIVPQRECIAAVCSTKINGCRHQSGTCKWCCHDFISKTYCMKSTLCMVNFALLWILWKYL